MMIVLEGDGHKRSQETSAAFVGAKKLGNNIASLNYELQVGGNLVTQCDQ